MFSRAIFISVVVGCWAAISLTGCSTGDSRVWFDNKISFANYRQLVIDPVHNASGNPVPERVRIDLTNHLKEKFAANRLPIVSESRKDYRTLTVRTDIIVYLACDKRTFRGPVGAVMLGPGQSAPRSNTKSMINLRTQLIDKSLNQVVADITTTRAVGACFTDLDEYQWLLESAAEEVTAEVARIMALEGPG